MAQLKVKFVEDERQLELVVWRSILACAAAKAFAQSLLEQRGGTGVDGPTPSLSGRVETVPPGI